jgi:hypothetical protein
MNINFHLEELINFQELIEVLGHLRLAASHKHNTSVYNFKP